MADMSVSSFLVVLFAVLVIAIATYASHLEDQLAAERRARRVDQQLARIFQEQARRERAKNEGRDEAAAAVAQAEELVNRQ